MQSSMLEKKVERKVSKATKHVPGVVMSAKFIQQDKKNLKVIDRDGIEISMEEMQKRSREGQGGAKRK